MTYDLRHLDHVRKELDKVSPSFCMAKWDQVTIHLQNGHTHSCHHPGTHKIPLEELKANPSALHNTLFKKEQRRLMRNGQRPTECQYCWNIEDASKDNFSDRHLKSASDWAWPNFEKIRSASIEENFQPSYVEVSFSHHCNFKCSYCMPHISSKWMEEIKSYGPYPTRWRHNNLEELAQKELTPIDEEQNPYVAAFWKWWPELYPSLKVFRITGGEPLLSPSTFKVLEKVKENPNPNMVLAINSNLGVPDKQIDRFLDLLRGISEDNKLRGLEIYTSIDTWGDHAEYIRNGLEIERFKRNVEKVLSSVPALRFNFMVTYNVFSPFRFKEYLEWALDLKHRHQNAHGTKQVMIDISYLRNPEHQSVRILPVSIVEKIQESVDYMKENLTQAPGNFYSAGFFPHEMHKLERIIDWIKSPQDLVRLEQNRIDFVKFFTEHDRRRGTNFQKTFPQLASLVDQMKIS